MKPRLIALTLFASLLPIPRPVLLDIIGNLTIPPLEDGETYVVNFDYRAYSSGLLDLKVILNHETYHNIPIYQFYQEVNIGYIPFSFSLSGYLTILRDTVLTIVAIKNDKTVSKQVQISKKDQLLIYPHLSGSAYESFSSIAKIDELGNVSHIKERLSFNSFEPIVEQAYSLYFPLNVFTIKHNLSSLGYPLSSRLAELIIEDRYHIFPRLPKGESSNYRKLVLRYYLDNDHYHFSFESPLYVDKQTRMMSLQPEVGFHLTDKLYFPTNHHSEVQSLRFQIKLFDVGVNDYQIDYQGTLFSNASYIGNPFSSFYSVTVTFSETDNIDDLKEIIIDE